MLRYYYNAVNINRRNIMSSCYIPLVKILELIFTISCIILHSLSLKPVDTDHFTLLATTFFGFLIIEIGVIFSYLINDPVPAMVDALYSICGVALFLTCGVLSLRFWEDEPRDLMIVRFGLWKGVLSSISSVLFLFDSFKILTKGYNVCFNNRPNNVL